MSWAELTRTPSRLTAEAPNREERARLLAAVTARGFIDDYSGVRISKSGRRFRIARATSLEFDRRSRAAMRDRRPRSSTGNSCELFSPHSLHV